MKTRKLSAKSQDILCLKFCRHPKWDKIKQNTIFLFESMIC